MRQQSLIASLFLASASAISQSDRGQPGHSFVAKETVVCKELDFKVTAGATNVLFNITAPSTQADFAAALNAILTGQLNPVGGTKNVAPATYKIHGQYCSPAACDKTKRTSDKKRQNAIQVIHHSALEQGITEFDIKVKPDIYSYQRQAAESGLSTLVIERLGSGQSDIPEDGINLVQSPLHVEMFHQIVKGVKDGTLLGKKFSTVIGVGHSYGASLINQHTVAYPSDFHSVILLGYSHVLNPTFPALLNLTQAPSKGTNLPNLNKASNSYLVHATIQDRINAFYTVGNFDQAILEYDNANEGIFTIGEILTLQSNQVTAPKFSGNVAYFNGQEDVGFGIKDLNDERPFWPKAKSISFNTYPKTGHGILAHLNAKQVQKDINAFVAKVL